MEENVFNVIVWDFNKQKFVPYDILPHLRDCLNKRKEIFENYRKTEEYKKSEHPDENLIFPSTFDELKEFIRKESVCKWWARCEYEIILVDWPNHTKSEKIDVYWQIMQNIDIITNILYKEWSIYIFNI